MALASKTAKIVVKATLPYLMLGDFYRLLQRLSSRGISPLDRG
jgi:hypothetical protein